MKKLLILLGFLVLFSMFGIAQTPLEVKYCAASLTQYSEQELLDLGIFAEDISNASDCVCYGAEPEYSQWLFSQAYCENNKRVEPRHVFSLVPPNCSVREKTVEYRSVADERCLGLPEPKIISDWGVVGCYSNGKVESRTVVAYFFSDNPNEGPEKGQRTQLRTVEEPCNFFTDVLNSPDFWLNGAGIFLIVISVIVLFVNGKSLLRSI